MSAGGNGASERFQHQCARAARGTEDAGKDGKPETREREAARNIRLPCLRKQLLWRREALHRRLRVSRCRNGDCGYGDCGVEYGYGPVGYAGAWAGADAGACPGGINEALGMVGPSGPGWLYGDGPLLMESISPSRLPGAVLGSRASIACSLFEHHVPFASSEIPRYERFRAGYNRVVEVRIVPESATLPAMDNCRENSTSLDRAGCLPTACTQRACQHLNTQRSSSASLAKLPSPPARPSPRICSQAPTPMRYVGASPIPPRLAACWSCARRSASVALATSARM